MPLVVFLNYNDFALESEYNDASKASLCLPSPSLKLERKSNNVLSLFLRGGATMIIIITKKSLGKKLRSELYIYDINVVARFVIFPL